MTQYVLVSLLTLTFACSLQAQVLVDSTFAQPDQNLLTITNTEVGNGWYAESNGPVGFTRDGVTPPAAGSRDYAVGEMGRIGGSQNKATWFGQVVDGGSSTGTLTLDIDYRFANASASFFVEVYGATGGAAPNFALDNDTMGAGWTLLNTTTNVAISGTDAAANESISFDMGSGYDFLGVRIRSDNLGSNATSGAEELAFTSIAIVPEPSVAHLMLLGVATLALLGRRRMAWI